jgi:hypothetical protein
MGIGIEIEVDHSATRVPKGVANDFRDRGGETRLFRRVELQEPRDLCSALSCGDDVLIVMEVEREQ